MNSKRTSTAINSALSADLKNFTNNKKFHELRIDTVNGIEAEDSI